MPHVRLGRPTFLPDLARGAALGAALAVPLAILLALLDFPEWGDTLASFVFTLIFFLPVALLFRLGMHLMRAYVHHGRTMPSREEREEDLKWSRPVIAVSFGALVAWLVLALASGLGTGDWSP